MRDWQTELDELSRHATDFVKTVKMKAKPSAVSARLVFKPASAPFFTAKSGEREEIMERVARFKEHQQRAIRDREEYATSVLIKMKATPRTWS
jgi:hypothetical protein